MNIEETKKIWKEKLASILKLTNEIQNFDNTKLKSPYTELIYDGELLVGSKVSIKNENGDIVSAPDGEHKLEDGSVITIVYGSVTQINGSTSDTTDTETEPEAETKPAEMNEDIPEVNPETENTDNTSELEARITNLETEIASILEKLNELAGSTEVAMSKVKELSEQPATDKSIEFSKTNINKSSKEDEIEAKRERFNNYFKSK